MSRVASVVFAVLFATSSIAAPVFSGFELLTLPLEHGGGCCKSSPPGKCCHMQKSTGQVHCH
jgi:hypothetical protein